VVICPERGADCLHNYGPADATAVPKPHRLLPRSNPDWFYRSGTGLRRLSWKRGRWTGAVVSGRTASEYGDAPPCRAGDDRASDSWTSRLTGRPAACSATTIYDQSTGEATTARSRASRPCTATSETLPPPAAEEPGDIAYAR